MKKMVFGVLLVGLAANVGLGAPATTGGTIQLSLGGNLIMLKTTYEDDSYTLGGAVVRVDFNLGRSISLAPELSGGFGGASGGATLNLRAGRYFAGAGALAVSGLDDEWGVQTLLKVHAGFKGPRALLAAAFLTNRWFKGFGLTVAYVF